MEQTYIIYTNRHLGYNSDSYTFFRVGCKRVSTAQKYIANWAAQAVKGFGLDRLFRKYFCIEGARYEILDNNRTIVAEGLIADLCPEVATLYNTQK